MKFAILVYENNAQFEARVDPEVQRAYWGAYTAYGAAMAQAGVLQSGAGLLPSHAATSVRVDQAQTRVQAGPFVETREQLGGFYLIDVPDLDAAIAWAAKCPSTQGGGGVEIRPLLVM